MRYHILRFLSIALILSLLTPTIASAADYTLTLSSDEVLAIAKALREQPYKDVAGILQKMQQQLNAEDAARLKPTPAPEQPAEQPPDQK